MLLNEFDIEYMERKVIKGKVITDQLAYAPTQAFTPLVFEFPNEVIFKLDTSTKWKMYFD